VPDPEQVSQFPVHRVSTALQLKLVSDPEQVSQVPWQRLLSPWQLKLVPEPTHSSQLPPQSLLFAAQLYAFPLPWHTLQFPVQALSLGWQLNVTPEQLSQLPRQSASSAMQSKVVPLPEHVEHVPAQAVASPVHVNVSSLPAHVLQIPSHSDSSAMQVPFEQLPQFPSPHMVSSGRSSCSHLPDTHRSSVQGLLSSHSAGPSQPMKHSPARQTPGTPSHAWLSGIVSPEQPPSARFVSPLVHGSWSSQAPGSGSGLPSNGSGMQIRIEPPDAGYSPSTSQKGRSGSVHWALSSHSGAGLVGSAHVARSAIERSRARSRRFIMDTVVGPGEPLLRVLEQKGEL
jgi:hypothetical protein